MIFELVIQRAHSKKYTGGLFNKEDKQSDIFVGLTLEEVLQKIKIAIKSGIVQVKTNEQFLKDLQNAADQILEDELPPDFHITLPNSEKEENEE